MSTQETEHDANSTFNTDHLSVLVTKKPHCQVKFEIRVKPEAIEAVYHKALKNINKEVMIPGFRKGRAPESLIVEKYQSSIQKEFVDIALQTAFNEAIHLTHLHPLKDGKIKRPVVIECSRETGGHFVIEFESRPVIPTVRFEDLQIPQPPSAPITNQEKQNALHNLLLQFATYDPIENRPVQEEDFINVSVVILEDPPREVIHNQRTQVNSKGLPSWLLQKVIGLNVGESAEGMTEQDLHLTEPDPNFQSLPFRVTVNAIWQGHLPAVDEELAKRVGLQSVEDLHKKIDERLEQETQEEAYQFKIQALEQRLVEKYPVDLPQSYIDTNKEVRLETYLQKLEEQQRVYSEEEYRQIENTIEQSTLFHLQVFFLLRKIAADHNITVENHDIAQELTHQVALMSRGQGNLDFAGDRKELEEQLYRLALDRKIKQFLLDHITFEE